VSAKADEGGVIIKINKILNNNVAEVLDAENRQIIITGRGICFRKKIGDTIDPDLIQKKFILYNPEV